MSKTYKLTFITIGISEDQPNILIRGQHGWDGKEDSVNETMKKINPKAKIRTEWTYMEGMQFEAYSVIWE